MTINVAVGQFEFKWNMARQTWRNQVKQSNHTQRYGAYKWVPGDMAPQDRLPPPPSPPSAKTMLHTIIATLFALLAFIFPLVEAVNKNNTKSAVKLAGGVLAGIIVGIVVFFSKCSPVKSVTLLINILSHYCCYYFLRCQEETRRKKEQGTRTILIYGRQHTAHANDCPIIIRRSPVIPPSF